MPMNFTRLRTLVSDVPRHAKLTYCLLRDSRVPATPKAALLAGLGIIVSPIDLPAWVPVVGELDMLALGVLAVKVFVDACPEEVVAEHQAALKAGTSVFDDDWRAARALALMGAKRALKRVARGRRRVRLLQAQREDRSA